MAKCENRIFKNIESTCETAGTAGLEATIYLFNRTELIVSQDDAENEPNVVNNLSLVSPATGYTAKGYKNNMTAGFTRNVSDTTVDTWTDTLSLTGYEFSADAARNFDNFGDVVAVIERKVSRKQKEEADGIFIILGLENGLYVSDDSWASGENNGARTITLSSLSDSGESCSYYVLTVKTGSPEKPDYAATKALLESLVQ